MPVIMEQESLTPRATHPGKADPASGTFFNWCDRKFEYLAATKAMESTRAPGKTSFTSALIWALETLAESGEAFTTEELLKGTMNEAPHFPKNQTPVLFDRFHYSPAWRIVLSPLSARKRIQEPRMYLDLDMREQHTLTLHFDFAEIPSLPVIETLGRNVNDILSTSDRLLIDTIRWGGVRSRPPNDFTAFHPQVIVDEGKQRCGITQRNRENKCDSSICTETPLLKHPYPISLARQTPEKRSPVLRGPLVLNGQVTSPGPTSFLLDLSEESEDQRPTLRKKNWSSGQSPSIRQSVRS